MKNILFISALLWLHVATIFAQSVPWERINPNPIESTLNEIVNVPESNRLIAVGSMATVVFSDNGGDSWITEYKPAGISRMTNLNAIQFVNSDLGFLVGEHSTLLKTPNGGMSWVNIPQQGNMAYLDVYFIDEQTGFVTKHDTVMKTTDGGSSWVQTELMPHWYDPKSLHFINDSTGYLGNTNGLYYFKTTDCGDSWDSIPINPAIENFRMVAIKFIDENTGLISGVIDSQSNPEYLILRTDNGGESWSEVYSDSHKTIRSFYFINPLTGYALGPTIPGYNIILKTNDGGLTWSETFTGSSWWYLNSLAFSPDGTGIAVGSYGQIVKSTDDGNQWFSTYQKLIDNSIINKAVAVNQSTVFISTKSLTNVCASAGCIFKSIDAGYSWDKVFDLLPFNTLQFLNNDVGFTSYNHIEAIYKTTNGGTDWTEYHIDDENHFKPECLWFINDSTGFVGGEDLIYKTTDGCETWEICADNYQLGGIKDITFKDDSTGFAAGYFSDLFLRTFDQGATWVTDTFDVSIVANRLYFINADTGFVIGNKILKTMDGGDTWFEVPNGCDGFISCNDIDFPSDQVGYITVSNNENTVLKTVDGGDSWQPIGLMETTATPKTLAFFSENEGLIMGEYSIIFKTYTGGMVGTPENKISKNQNTHIKCYPNPVSNTLTIELNKKSNWQTLEFYSINGELVKKVILSQKLSNISIDVSGLTTGIYFVVSKSGNRIDGAAKIVKL